MENNNRIAKNLNTAYEATALSLENLTSSFAEYKDIVNAFSDGIKTVELRKRYMLKQIDEAWVSAIEDALPSIDGIIRNPENALREHEEVLPVELTRKVTERSVVYLSQHTDMINEIKPDGTVIPSKLLNVFQEDTVLTYENKFINTLLVRIYTFVLKRYEMAKENGEDEKNTQLKIEQRFEKGEVKGKITLDVELSQPFDKNDVEKNYFYFSPLWKRVCNLKKIVDKYMSSPFVAELGKNYVRPPIMRTNKLLKNVDFRNCLSLWEFLDSYENTGYETLISEKIENVSEDCVRDFYETLAEQYVLFEKHICNSAETEVLDERDLRMVSPRVKNELDEFDESEYDYKEEIPKYGAEPETGEKEDEEIEYAVRVALAADASFATENEQTKESEKSEKSKFGSYVYSFTSKLIITQNPNQLYYDDLKNELLSYNGIKARMSFKHETFSFRKNLCAIMNIRGKTLYLYFPLDAEKCDAKYRLENVTLNKKQLARLKIKSDRSVKYAKQLIALQMAITKTEKCEDYLFSNYRKPYKTIWQMLELGLIKYSNKSKMQENAAAGDVKIHYLYRYSFEAKLILTQNPNQSYYGEIKNELLSYKGVKSRMSFKKETFTISKSLCVFMNIRGKTLNLYLPLNADEYEGKYRFENVILNKKQFAKMKIRSDRGVKYAKELIATLMSKEKIDKKKDFIPSNYAKPSKSILQMLRLGLIKSKND